MQAYLLDYSPKFHTVKTITIPTTAWAEDKYVYTDTLLSEDCVIVVAPEEARENILTYSSLKITAEHTGNTVTFTKEPLIEPKEVQVNLLILE